MGRGFPSPSINGNRRLGGAPLALSPSSQGDNVSCRIIRATWPLMEKNIVKQKLGTTRRGFGKALAQAGAAVAVPAVVAAPATAQIATPAPGQVGPVLVGNYAMVDQIRVGGIGIRGRGMADLLMMLGDERVRCVGIADIRDSAREMVKSAVDGYYKTNDCVMY